ncbi:hypothetical protein QYE76_035915 [Lolium multiflorum]|uniref:Transposase (putative) gypsy type domain-containing protein n=1 Tax=Lolium multiflorum TaxID=4521 RepID=A0AAD8VLM0_LOLMU|nr:hypothetical protein QYE76_035915 [Lolium multiflorum]
MISAHWSFIRDTDVPKPGAGEVVMTKAWVERGLSLPCSEFFLSILNTYGLQPHNICPNSYLLLSNFVTLCEGHLGIRPDIRLWQFFFRVKKEMKDKAMVNCGSMTFMLRPGRMYPPHDSHESVRYWNAGWFYEKNASVPDIHDGLPKFINEPPEELASWSFVPSLAQTPILEKAARRISWLVHDGLTGAQLTLSWFTRRIQPLRTMRLNTLAEENFRTILRVPVSGDAAEEVPEDEEEEDEQAPRKAAPHPSKRPHAKASGSEAGASGEASAKKPKTVKPPPLDSRKAERERLKMLSTAGKRSRPNIPGAPNPTSTATRTSSQEPITKYMKKSPAVGPTTPAPPSASHPTPQPSPPQANQSPPPAANTPPEIIPAELKREQAEKQLAEKNSEHVKEKGEFILKRNADSETIKRQQKELNGLWKYMETAERHWDSLNEQILEPLGYPEKRRNRFPRDDLLTLAGDDCKDLISASRKICHNLSLKKSRTCGLRKLINRMDILPELVTDLQASSTRGAAAMTLTMCLAHNPELDLEQVTTGVPPTRMLTRSWMR